MVGKNSESEVVDHLYDLILELHAIDSSVLLAVMPQLEFKLKVCVKVLGGGNSAKSIANLTHGPPKFEREIFELRSQ